MSQTQSQTMTAKQLMALPREERLAICKQAGSGFARALGYGKDQGRDVGMSWSR